MRRNLVVVGSLNLDFVVRVAHIPAPGETILGDRFETIPGGKGANQAVAAGKLHTAGRVQMAGCVGEDAAAGALRASLRAAGVDDAAVRTVPAPSGIAMISVSAAGENSIVVAPGANRAMGVADVAALRPLFREAAAVLVQLETPLEAVEATLALAREEGAVTILDPAPAQPLPAALLALVDYLTPNESEAALLGDAVDAARQVVYKLGARGCRCGEIEVPGFAVDAVDTTAAGDTFNAGFAVALAEGRELRAALEFATAAAALSVTRPGAQASAPTRGEVETFLLTALSYRRT